MWAEAYSVLNTLGIPHHPYMGKWSLEDACIGMGALCQSVFSSQ